MISGILSLMTSAPARTSSAEVSDADLAKQARSGDRDSLDQLVRRHAADVYKLCHHVAGREDGRDAARVLLTEFVEAAAEPGHLTLMRAQFDIDTNRGNLAEEGLRVLVRGCVGHGSLSG